MATPEEITRIKKLMAELPPEARAEIKAQYRERINRPGIIPQSGERTATGIFGDAALGGMGVPSAQTGGEAVDNLATGLAIGTTAPVVAGTVGGLATAAAIGRTALGGVSKKLLQRTAVGALAGGALGETPIPVVGGRGFKEGAKLGAMFGAGQGGMGALWKHGKFKSTIDWIVTKLVGGADEAVTATAGQAGRTLARLPRETLTRAPAGPGAANVTRMPTGPAPTVPPRMSAPTSSASQMSAPAPASPPVPPGPFGTAGNVAPAVNPPGLVQGAIEAAKRFDLKAGEKVYNITVAGQPLEWFKSGALAGGKLRSLASKNGWQKIGVGKYKTPTGEIVETSWTEAMRSAPGKMATTGAR